LLSDDAYLLQVEGLQTNRVFSFYSRDAMLVRYLPSSCLSVCPSVWQVGCSTNATIVGYGRCTMWKWSNSHGASTVAVESYGLREIFWTFLHTV